ncbi:MAG TPA: hypothetical protein VMD92_19500 [Acidobacteriaceae bacterium]|nr:hypothetical protein [Acidobacteriaceae bacterium]
MNDSALTDTARHEYRMRNRKFLPIVLMGVMALIMAPVVVIHADPVTLLPACIFAPICAGLLWFVLRSRLILEGSQLTVRGMFRTRVLGPDEIDGIRTYSSRSGTYRALCLKHGGGPISFTQYSTDDAFRSWLEQFPDLDARDRKEALEKISEDQELGATPEERMEALTRARTFFKAVAVFAVVAGLGYNLAPMPWRLWCFAVVAIMPVLACFLLYRSPVLYTLGKSRADPRVDLLVLLLIAGFGLFIRGMRVEYVSSGPLVEDGIIVGIVFLVAFFRPATRGGQPGILIPLCLFTAIFAFGLVTGANSVADPAPPQTFRAIVAGKHVTHGKSTTWYLTLGPWGPFSQLKDMRVSHARYDATSGGDTVCVLLHPGYLHAAWYEAADCPESPVDTPLQ